MMKTATTLDNQIQQILNEINSDNSLNLNSVNWKELTKAVRGEGVSKNSKSEKIKDTILDLFDSVGYEEFGISDNE
jgi:hypothetical protein